MNLVNRNSNKIIRYIIKIGFWYKIGGLFKGRSDFKMVFVVLINLC